MYIMVHPQAEELNKAIISENSVIFDLLSRRGKEIYFPKKGILAQSAEAKGKKINATIGSALEENGTPMKLECISKHIDLSSSDIFPYAPSFGKKELREKWKELLIQKNPTLSKKSFSLPVVTSALTHAISIAGYLFVDPGDTILSPDLYWGNYRLTLENAYGGAIQTFNTFKDDLFDVASFRKALSNSIGKKIVLLNFPNNPSGYSLQEEVTEIISTLKESAEKGNKIVVFIDDAYFGLAYEKTVFKESLFSELCNLHENILAVKIDGPTKEDYVWGFRIGFLTFGVKNGSDILYDALINKTAGAIRGNISNASNLSQSLLFEAYSDPFYDVEKQQKFEILKKRYDIIKKVLSENDYSSEFIALPFNSGYFMCISLKKDPEKVRQILLDMYDTGVIALNGIVRIAFSSVKNEDIPILFENIYKACKEA